MKEFCRDDLAPVGKRNIQSQASYDMHLIARTMQLLDRMLDP